MMFVYLKSMQHLLRGLRCDCSADAEAVRHIDASLNAIEQAILALH